MFKPIWQYALVMRWDSMRWRPDLLMAEFNVISSAPAAVQPVTANIATIKKALSP